MHDSTPLPLSYSSQLETPQIGSQGMYGIDHHHDIHMSCDWKDDDYPISSLSPPWPASRPTTVSQHAARPFASSPRFRPGSFRMAAGAAAHAEPIALPTNDNPKVSNC